MGFFIIFILIIAVIFLFSSPKLSPIPYFPSQSVDLLKIIKALNLKNNQTVIDLGAGDGIVIFKAAQQAYKRKLNTQFIAVDINPILVFIMFLRRLFHPNRKNIRIVLDDIFKMDFSHLTPNSYLLTFYLYISPWYIEKTILNIKKQVSKFKIVSYMYPVKSLDKTTFVKATVVKGKNSIFVYDL